MRRLGLRCLLSALSMVVSLEVQAQSTAPKGEWRAFGAEAANTKYSPLEQITADNFSDLEIAWRWTSLSAEVAIQDDAIRPGPFKTAPLW